MGALGSLFGGAKMARPDMPRIRRTPVREARRDSADGVMDASDRRRRMLAGGRNSSMLSGGGALSGTVGNQNTLG